MDAILVFAIAYLLIYKTWILGDLLAIELPRLLGIDFLRIMGEDLFNTWILYFEFIGMWICGLVIILVFKRYGPILKAFSTKLKRK